MKEKSEVKPLFYSLFCAAAVLAVASCAPKQSLREAPAQTNAATEVSTAPVVSTMAVTEASIRGGEFAAIDDLKPIFFDYDQAELKADARRTLKNNAQYIKEHPELEILIAGYCDQRGTVAYNLALGERRAKTVWHYYRQLGIHGSSMATISYGKERPFCSEMTEACWARNRRAQTEVRNKSNEQ